MPPDRTPIAITMGEPAGIGPELAIRLWKHLRCAPDPAMAIPIIWIGDPAVVTLYAPDLPVRCVESPDDAASVCDDAFPVLPVSAPAGAITPGAPGHGSAAAVIAAIDSAVDQVMAGACSGILTAPIQKSVLYGAGFDAPGHTEYLARKAGLAPEAAVMMLAIPGLRVVPATIHIPLAKVPAALTAARLRHVIDTTAQALARHFGIAAPRLAVTGLNPHAGEGGALGLEEIDVIAPVIEDCRRDGLTVTGPHPADTLFHAEARAGYDAAICMYHDQALAPLKALDFYRGVNLTLGLPFLRASPDHGTALDLAGTGKARPDSFAAAYGALCEAIRTRAAA